MKAPPHRRQLNRSSRSTKPKPIDWAAVAAASGARTLDEDERATIKRWVPALDEAYERVQQAKARDEKVNATIDYALTFQKIEAELNGGREELFLSEPDRKRRRALAHWKESEDANFIKHFLGKICSLTALEAEQEVAKYLGVNVETLRKRKTRARQILSRT
jgi:hypothetical protein